MLKRLILAGCLFGFADSANSPDKWDYLKVTFSFNVFSPWTFADLPRTEGEADENGWTKIADCDSNSKFQGARYVRAADHSVILLFDLNGFIAGIQCGISESHVSPVYPPLKQRGNIFQHDGDRYTLTAYFVDPTTICKYGRTEDEFNIYGTGTGLYIQNGSDPLTQSIRIPSTQSEISETKWTKGWCFLFMGDHYWYDLDKNMSCDDFQPVFLLYHGGWLTAFGWALGIGHNSMRFEHPSKTALSKFLDPVPQCLDNYPQLSTMHIYMTSPYNEWCWW
ncbi:uncharacterized protein [Littorina saxatilis]|uniref:Uncharacterized protein n=1 Tax=Littorina saxatilis TaxID=31220 RepID=A0AAN9BR14_9CAEN